MTEFNPSHARDHDMHLLMRFQHSQKTRSRKTKVALLLCQWFIHKSNLNVLILISMIFLFNLSARYFHTSAVRLTALNKIVKKCKNDIFLRLILNADKEVVVYSS